MQFLYTNNGNGVLSSIVSSWLFWLVIVLIVIVIFVSILSTNKDFQKKLHVEKMFGNAYIESPPATEHSDNVIQEIRQSLINEINDENQKMSQMYNGPVPDLNKYIGDELDQELAQSALLLGVSDTNKDVKLFYHTSSKHVNNYKIADDTLNAVHFKIELRDLSKITYNPLLTSEVRIYNQNRKCMFIMSLRNKLIKITSNSPFFDDVTLPLDDDKRLLVFNQVSNKLYIGSKQVAAFDIYDKIRYFSVNSPIIKELQYSLHE